MIISAYIPMISAVIILIAIELLRASVRRLSSTIDKQNQAIQSIASVCKRLQDRLDIMDREIEMHRLPSWMK